MPVLVTDYFRREQNAKLINQWQFYKSSEIHNLGKIILFVQELCSSMEVLTHCEKVHFKRKTTNVSKKYLQNTEMAQKGRMLCLSSLIHHHTLVFTNHIP
jgi:hypothetical protein